jgi:2-methylaconitate cis-trans-isomerase PrpF
MKFQERFRCFIVRGGTSKGVFLIRNELPQDPERRDKVILAIYGSPDIRQIDGLGGADVLTSKCAIIGSPTRSDADVDYTFGQVGILEPKVEYITTCGNISAGVGPFAIYLGLAKKKEPITTVRIHLTNNNRIVNAEVPVEDGEVAIEGDYKIDGCPGTGARILLDYSDMGGAVTNKILPTGNPKDTLTVEGMGEIQVSLVDAGNPIVFVHAPTVGLKGTESPMEIEEDHDLLERLEIIRSVAAERLGLAADWRKATTESQFLPFIGIVNAPEDYVDFTTGNVVKKDSFDIMARMLFNQRMHKTYAGTGTVCTGTAARIPGTIVNDFTSQSGAKEVRIGHPAGVISIDMDVEMEGDKPVLKRAAFGRTARIVLEGHVFVRKSLIQ